MKNDYSELVRRSIRKDFANANFKKLGQQVKAPHPLNTKRITGVRKQCDYFKYSRFLLGKLVRILEETNTGGKWVEFVNDNDRKALNNAAGWSDGKNRYLLYAVTFDN